MISEEGLSEIRDYLERAQDPLFLFDDDNDGLCSFLLLRNFVDRGGGVQVKTNPELNESLLDVVKTYNADFLFILDKPLVSQEFINGISLPIVWIDHHPIVKREGVKYYNPKLDGSDDHSSTTYWCYKAVGGKLWIAVVGAVSDWTVPDYFSEFKEKYPDLVGDKDKPADLLFGTKLGRLCRIFSLLNKEKYSEFDKIIKTISKIESPYEILNKESEEGKFLAEKVEKTEKIYNELLEKSLGVDEDGKLLLFSYASEQHSFTSDLSNELIYRRPGKFIIVARIKEDMVNMSLRSDSIEVRPILEKALSEVEKAYGGGHLFACGAGVPKEDFDMFIGVIKREING